MTKTSPHPFAITNVKRRAVIETKPIATANWVRGGAGDGNGGMCPLSPTYESTFNPTRYNAQLPRGAAEAKRGRKTVKQFSATQPRTYHPSARASTMLAMETAMNAPNAEEGKHS